MQNNNNKLNVNEIQQWHRQKYQQERWKIILRKCSRLVPNQNGKKNIWLKLNCHHKAVKMLVINKFCRKTRCFSPIFFIYKFIISLNNLSDTFAIFSPHTHTAHTRRNGRKQCTVAKAQKEPQNTHWCRLCSFSLMSHLFHWRQHVRNDYTTMSLHLATDSFPISS
jgi:hypothetical protein